MKLMNISNLSVKFIKYSSGFFGILFINNAIITMIIYRYDPGLPNPQNWPFFVSSAWVGLAMFLSGITGAVLQPFIGYISDHYQSYWGCRRPFLTIAIFPLVVSFIILFIPPFGYPETINVLYLIVLLCLFYLSLAIYQIPYLAWLSTLARTAKQRINLSGMMAFCGLLGAASAGISSPWLTEHYGFQGMAFTIGIISLVVLSIPLTIEEDAILSPREISNNQALPFWNSLQIAWQNPNFRIYSGGLATAWIAVSILSISPTFLAVTLLHQDISFASAINALVLGGAVGGFFFVIPLSRYLGKAITFQWSMLWLGCGFITLGILPVAAGRYLLPWSILLLLTSLGLAGFFMLPNAILPDIVEEDTSSKGVTKEAIYFGVRGCLIEVSRGLGAALTGILLILGKTPAHPWGVQLSLPTAGLFALISAWAFSQYRLQKNK